jgi:AraC-like DNA-binding protein/NADH:ubiquinone oxidoreductase subunit 6 (subunit J)
VFEQVSHVLIYAGIVQGFFVALLLNSRSVKRSRANIFLSILLISLSFSIAHISYAGSVINHFSIKVYSVGDPTFFLIAPFLWLYTTELTGQRVGFSWKVVVHFLPFLLIILFSLSLHSIHSAEIAEIMNHGHRIGSVLFWIVLLIQFSCYLFFIHKRWKKYQAIIQQEISNTENVNISWVRFFLAVFQLVNLFFLFSLFAVIHLQTKTWLFESVGVIFSLSIFALGYKGILQREILQPSVREENSDPPSFVSKENKQHDQELIDRITSFMNDKKPFLDPELTLTSLALQLSLNRSQLSQLINEGMGDNFYNFVNKFRVEEVKRLMVNPKYKNLNMLGLAFEAGFKSKSTFNLIFKRFTGLTPSEYRRNLAE